VKEHSISSPWTDDTKRKHPSETGLTAMYSLMNTVGDIDVISSRASAIHS
jgi:hypothetical protein